MLNKLKTLKGLSGDKSKLKLGDFDFKIGSLNTIKGKVMTMAIIPVVAVIILATFSLNVLSRNAKDYDLLVAMDEINNIQNQNQVLNQEYSNSLYNGIWDQIIENLQFMNEKAKNMQSKAAFTKKNEMKEISNIIAENSEVSRQIKEKNEARGFYSSEALYAQFVQNESDLAGLLHDAQWGNSWIDLFMDSVGNLRGETVEIAGSQYHKTYYETDYPKQGKRNQLLIRIGTVDSQFKDEIYLNNIILSNGTEEVKVNLSEMTVDDLANSSGELSGYELVEFNGAAAIKVNANFNTVDNVWQEIAISVPIANMDIESYNKISYEFYTKGEPLYSLSLGCALKDVYSFVDKYYTISSIEEYNRNIAKGDLNWEDENSQVNTLFNTIYFGFQEIKDNLPVYLVDENLVNNASAFIQNKIDVLDTMGQIDREILALKVTRANLEEQLVQNINEIRTEIQSSISSRKAMMQVLVVFITAALILLISLMSIYIVRSLNTSIKAFSDTLDEMAQGNLTVRCDISSKDEFSIFAGSLNTFTDKLCKILNDIQILVNDVEQKNRLFGQLFKQITEGPNGNEKVLVEKGMIELKEVFEEIIKSVSTQNKNTDSALVSLNGIVNKNSVILERMVTTKETSDRALEKVQEGYESIKELIDEVKNINMSVENANLEVDALIKNAEDIGNILVSIQNLSKQTDLLSLNAAIEASRAGESGKGFAVVAAEIKKLSEQTSIETKAIDSLIQEINQKIDKVQSANKAVVTNVDNTLQITDQFAKAITEVTEATQSSTGEINQLFTTIEEQNKSVLAIAGVVEEISEEAKEVQDQAQTTTEITKQVSEAMVDNLEEIEKLMKDTTQLKTEIEFFKTNS